MAPPDTKPHKQIFNVFLDIPTRYAYWKTVFNLKVHSIIVEMNPKIPPNWGHIFFYYNQTFLLHSIVIIYFHMRNLRFPTHAGHAPGQTAIKPSYNTTAVKRTPHYPNIIVGL